MNKNLKNLLIIFCLVLLLFSGYFLRQGFFGGDSYFYLNYVCHGTNFDRVGIEQVIFSLLPCDFFALKLIQALCIIITLFIINKTTELFYPNQGLLSAIIALGLSPALMLVGLKFENDFFALPLIALSIYFYYLNQKTQNKKWVIVSLLCLIPATLIYNLSFFVLIMFATTNIFFLGAFILALILFGERIIGAFIPNLAISEMIPFIGLTNIFLLCLGFIKPHKLRELITTTALILNQGKFIFLVPFFFPMSIIKTCEWIDEKTKKQELKGFIYKFTIGISILLVIGYSFLAYEYPPSQEALELTQFAVKTQKDLNIPLYNDWSLGWHTQYFGYPTQFKASIPNPTYDYNFEYLALTHSDLNCQIIKKTSAYTLFICNKTT